MSSYDMIGRIRRARDVSIDGEQEQGTSARPNYETRWLSKRVSAHHGTSTRARRGAPLRCGAQRSHFVDFVEVNCSLLTIHPVTRSP